MDLDIKTKEKNEVFKRQEVVAETTEKITPSKEAVQEKLAALLNIPKEQIIVSKIETGFGSNKATIYARAYESEEQMKDVEPKYTVARNFGVPEEEKKEEAKAEAPAEATEGKAGKKKEAEGEEKPAEEPKEEVKEEKAEEKKEETKEEPAAEEPKEEAKEEVKEEAKEEKPSEEKKEGEQ